MECLFWMRGDTAAIRKGYRAISPRSSREAGGEILVSRLWEERRLAYSINGQRKGVYWLVYFRLDGNRLAACGSSSN